MMKKQSAVYLPEDSLEAIGLGFIPGTIAINIQRLWSKMGVLLRSTLLNTIAINIYINMFTLVSFGSIYTPKKTTLLNIIH